MDKKLTIANLAPYLPYSLKILDVRFNNIFTMTALNTDMNLSENFKPHFRPLSDLGKAEFKECHNVIDWNALKQRCEINTDNLSGYTELQIFIDTMEFLYKNHFDVFGLIDKGLALDINLTNSYEQHIR